MFDRSEIAALQASLQGALAAAEALTALRDRLAALGPADDIDPATLEDLQRVSAAHAVASNALRGLVETMVRRRATG